jgi:hypothetical protein
VRAVLESPLRSEEFFERASGAVLSTRRIAASSDGRGMDHVVEGRQTAELFAESSPTSAA